VRANLKSLGESAEEKELRSKYVKKMTEEEDAIQMIDVKRADLIKQRMGKQKDLDAALAALNADYQM